jgi:hypothetical protein
MSDAQEPSAKSPSAESSSMPPPPAELSSMPPPAESSAEPTITILIIAHGFDTNKNLKKMDKNVRILSRAGVPGCLGVCSSHDYGLIFNEYENNMEKDLSSYQKLEKIKETFFSTLQCSQLYDTTLKSWPDKSFGKYSLDIISNKRHGKIYRPYFEHNYTFNWRYEYNPGIHVVEIKNPLPTNDLKYQDNLLKTHFFVDKFTNPTLIRYNIERLIKVMFEYIFFPSFNNKIVFKTLEDMTQSFVSLNEYEIQVKREFLKWIRLQISADGIETARTEIRKDMNKRIDQLKKNFINKNFKSYIDNIIEFFIFSNFTSIDIIGFIEEIKTLHKDPDFIDGFPSRVFNGNEKDCKFFIDNIIEKHDKLVEILNIEIIKDYENVEINTSSIIELLKSKGYSVINIIDLSCRFVDEKHYSEEKYGYLNQLDAEENERVHKEPFDKTIGGKMNDKTKSKTKKYKTKRKRRTIKHK